MDERKIDRTDEEGLIDLSRLLREARSVLRRLYWLPLALAAVMALLICLHGWRSYQPMYASEATFTIQVVSGTGSDIAGGGYGYYDKATAEQLGKTFPYLIQSDLMRGKLCRAMGVTTLNGTITAQTVSDTNLFTIRVTRPSAQDAKAILDKVIELYPDVAGYVIGSTSMNLLTQPQAATEPYNAFHPLRSAAAAMTDGDAAIAVAAGILLQNLGQAGFGLDMLVDAVKAVDRHVSAGRGGRLKSFDRHFLHSDLELGCVVAGQGACTNSNFASQYELGGTYAPICDFDLLMAAVESAKELGVKMPVGNLYSSDTFYDAAGRNTRFGKMGIMAVEMEAAALYCTAAYLGKRALAICSISDNLITGEELSADERQTNFTNMMKIGLEIAVKMAQK